MARHPAPFCTIFNNLLWRLADICGHCSSAGAEQKQNTVQQLFWHRPRRRIVGLVTTIRCEWVISSLHGAENTRRYETDDWNKTQSYDRCLSTDDPRFNWIRTACCSATRTRCNIYTIYSRIIDAPVAGCAVIIRQLGHVNWLTAQSITDDARATGARVAAFADDDCNNLINAADMRVLCTHCYAATTAQRRSTGQSRCRLPIVMQTFHDDEDGGCPPLRLSVSWWLGVLKNGNLQTVPTWWIRAVPELISDAVLRRKNYNVQDY